MKNNIRLTETAAIFDRIRNDPRQRVVKSTLLNLLIFVLFELVNQVVQSIAIVVCMLPGMVRQAVNGEPVKMDLESVSGLLIMLYLTLVCILLCFVYCLAIERRKVRTMGLTQRHALRDYLIGAVVGIGMMGAAILISWAGGGVQFLGVNASVPWGTMLAFLCGWMIQGFSEELNFRGVIMMTVGTHHKPVTAVAVSSVLISFISLIL
mgnify:CR=1 FL=1